MMKGLVSGLALATLLTGCGLAAAPPTSSSPTNSPTGPTATAAAGTLLARPLKLPAVQAGSTCPVTPVTSRKLDITDARGSAPFFLGGPMPHGAFAWNKMVWLLVDGGHGPVLFRGGRADGAGPLRFSGSPADPLDEGVSLSADGGVTASFYERMLVEGIADAFYVYPATTGCYALQVDGPSFEEVIVVMAA
jgi:hypothetical protein